MKVLTIGSDINLFKKNSDVAKRAVKYGWQPINTLSSTLPRKVLANWNFPIR